MNRTPFYQTLYDNVPANTVLCLTDIFESRIRNRFFNARDIEAIDNAINATVGKANIYMRVTPLHHQPERGRGVETDSVGSGVLWVDYDCYDDKLQGLMNLRESAKPPTLVVDSGGGIQAYWKLRSFCTDLYAIKSRNKALKQTLNTSDSEWADSCFDMARVLRVPDTPNVKYTPPKTARIIDYYPDRVYDLIDFPQADLEENAIQFWDNQPLPYNFYQDIKAADKKLYARIVTGESAKNSANGTVDRSENDWYCVNALFKLGYTPAQCITAMISGETLLSAKYRDTGRYDYVVTTVNKAWRSFMDSPEQYFIRGLNPGELVVRAMTGPNRGYLYTARTLRKYESGYYPKIDEDLFRHEVYTRLGARWKRAIQEEAINNVKAACYLDHKLCNATGSTHINCANGMLSIDTGELIPHDPKYLSLYQLPAGYDPHCDPTFVDQFVASIIPADSIPFFWEFIGSCFITNQYWPKAFLMLIGPSNSGKSTLLNFIRTMLGDENTESIPLQKLADNDFTAVKLVGKIANIFADLDTSESKSVGTIKTLTGDDRNYVEEKNQVGFSTPNYARLIFSANSYPTVKNADDAFYDRAKIIICANKFTGSKEDHTIKHRLEQPNNLSAALLRAFQGLQRLKAQNGFTASQAMRDANEDYRRYADVVVGFLRQCRYDQRYRTPKTTLYAAFKEFCIFGGHKVVTEGSFYRRVNDRMGDFAIGVITPEIEDRRIECYTGVKPPENYVTFSIAKGVNS